jgi:hypothetical protein
MLTDNLSPAFIPGQTTKRQQPLGRYLPPIPEGVAPAWLENHAPKGSWVLDPFGASPDLIGEIARQGYKVLVTANNPLLAFILKLNACPPKKEALNAALAILASAKIRSERLEPHIRELYQTPCRACGKTIAAQAFVWQKDGPAPIEVHYRCPYCEDQGEYPPTEEDIARATQFSQGGLHRARVLERVAPLHDPDRVYAEEALAVYPTRAIYVLSTLINRIEGEDLSIQDQDHLSALFIHAFDRANTLWPYPTARQRPRQLTIPPQYRENNIWLALEEAIGLWPSDRPAIPLTNWPERPPQSGGICVFEGRVKDFVKDLADLNFAAILTAFPRPNQAFWTLSALWAGWLWGSEATHDFKSVLRRQRYSWRWHSTALASALTSLRKNMPATTPFFGMISEVEAGFLCAVMSAAHLSKLYYLGLALRPEDDEAQLSFRIQKNRKQDAAPENLKDLLRKGAQVYMHQRGEPAKYISILAAGLGQVLQTPSADISPEERYDELQKSLEEAISYRGGFLRLGASGQTPEAGFWWLDKPDGNEAPLSDRIEIELVTNLINQPDSSLEDLDSNLCAAFPGLMTPSSALVCMCLESYGQQGASKKEGWLIRDDDLPSNRRKDLNDMTGLIQKLGSGLGFETLHAHADPLCFEWADNRKEILYTLFLTASAVLDNIFNPPLEIRGQPLIILPGGRANLVVFKLKDNPLWQGKVDQGWRFIKYRHLRLLAKNPILTPDNLDEQLSLDPLTYSDPQIRLL